MFVISIKGSVLITIMVATVAAIMVAAIIVGFTYAMKWIFNKYRRTRRRKTILHKADEKSIDEREEVRVVDRSIPTPNDENVIELHNSSYETHPDYHPQSDAPAFAQAAVPGTLENENFRIRDYHHEPDAREFSKGAVSRTTENENFHGRYYYRESDARAFPKGVVSRTTENKKIRGRDYYRKTKASAFPETGISNEHFRLDYYHESDACAFPKEVVPGASENEHFHIIYNADGGAHIKAVTTALMPSAENGVGSHESVYSIDHSPSKEYSFEYAPRGLDDEGYDENMGLDDEGYDENYEQNVSHSFGDD